MPDDRYALLVRKVWRGIERQTGYPPCPLPGGNVFGAFCPTGCGGTLAVTFIDPSTGPEAIISTEVGGRTGECSRGCSAEQILGALL